MESNKLNTNYTAVAFLLTSELPENYKTSSSFEDSIKYFFDIKNSDGVTPFESFMGRIGKENKEIRRDRRNQTSNQNRIWQYCSYVKLQQYGPRYFP